MVQYAFFFTGRDKMVDLLVRNRADSLLTDNHGKTALQLASSKGS